MLRAGNGIIRTGALSAMAAFVWASYYPLLFFVRELGPLSLFFYPSLFGGIAFLGYGFLARKTGRPTRKRDFVIPAAGYLSSQWSIILSSLLNGVILTSTFVLLGDTLLSPAIMILGGRSKNRPIMPYFITGMAILLFSVIFLSVQGPLKVEFSPLPMAVLVLTPVLVSLFFIYTNERIETDGLVSILTPCFLVAALISLPLVLTGRIGGLNVNMVELGVLISIGITSMFLGYLFFFVASDSGNFVLASVLMSLIPVFTVILQSLIYRRFPGIFDVLLIAGVCAGAAICTLGFSAQVDGLREAHLS
ncbi:MAG: DMT family transporter [Methanomassiliicoccales archaeon]